MASQKYRDAILEAMAGKEVPLDTTPEQVLSIMSMTIDEFAIIFTTKDLPPEGGDHNIALYVTIECIGRCWSTMDPRSKYARCALPPR